MNPSSRQDLLTAAAMIRTYAAGRWRDEAAKETPDKARLATLAWLERWAMEIEAAGNKEEETR